MATGQSTLVLEDSVPKRFRKNEILEGDLSTLSTPSGSLLNIAIVVWSVSVIGQQNKIGTWGQWPWYRVMDNEIHLVDPYPLHSSHTQQVLSLWAYTSIADDFKMWIVESKGTNRAV